MAEQNSLAGVEAQSQVGVAVARKAMDAVKQEGAAVIQMLQSAKQAAEAEAALASPEGVGGRVDVMG